MKADWRNSLAGMATLILIAIAAILPLLAPLLELVRFPSGWSAWTEADRLLSLVGASLAFCGLTLLFALPAGILAGLLLARTAVAGRRVWLLLGVFLLLLPVPVLAAGWKMAWHGLGLPPEDAPLARLFSAAALSALAAWPWVALVAALGFMAVEPELEEEALLLSPPWRVFRHVTWPRSRAVVGLAALWVFLLCWQEITLTDLFRIRTFGEEVYLQFSGGRDELARAVAVTLPVQLLVAGVAVLALRYYQRRVPAREQWFGSAVAFPLGRWWWLAWGFLLLLFVAALGLPLLGLVRQAGLRYATAAAPGPPTWDGPLLVARLGSQVTSQWWLLLESLGQAAVVGFISALAALWLLFLVRGRPRLTLAGTILAALLLATPGPVLGLGLLTVIERLISLPGFSWLGPLLYDRPSPLPVIWVQTLRFTPVACLALWPVVQLVPLALDEEVQLNGGGPWARFKLAYLMPLRRAWLATAAAVATLALGEISASKLVATPGDTYLPLAHHFFQLMHASADVELAALSLVLLGLVAGGALLVAAVRPRHPAR